MGDVKNKDKKTGKGGSAAAKGGPGTAHDDRFKYEVSDYPGGENLRRCFACGTCTLSCPVSEVEQEYSPRKIIRMILLGMKEAVLGSDAIWYCQSCYRCHVRCPQEVKYPEIMRVLRTMALEGGYVTPEFVQAVTDAERQAQEHRRELIKKIIEEKRGSLTKSK